MIARSELRKYDERERRHAGAGHRGPFGAVQLTALLAEQLGVGMSVASVVLAGFATGQQRIGFGRFGALVDARQIDRRCMRPRRAERRAAGGRGQMSSGVSIVLHPITKNLR